MPPAAAAETPSTAAPSAAPTIPHSVLPESVVVHPIVLLSVVDHYKRVALQVANKRVVGILLGESSKGKIEVSNSFAVPFEEDPKDESIWFLDHDYCETMYRMFTKVSAKERIVGFYSTGPKLRKNDLAIEADFRQKYLPHSSSPPVLVIIDVDPNKQGLPTSAYLAVDDLTSTGGKTFRHVQSEVGAYEAEEVGVEHLLRDINDPTVTTLASRVKNKLAGLEGLKLNLAVMKEYLQNVANGKLPVNLQVLNRMQEIVNLLPNLNLPEETVRAFLMKTNDMNLVIYVSSLVRAIIAMHNLLTNKIQLKEGALDAKPAVAAAAPK